VTASGSDAREIVSVPLREALGVFTAKTTLGPEHERLMRARHRPVAWEKSTADELPGELRAGLADLWRARTTSEHRSVGTFSLYALDLLGAGAPAEVLSHACRAALDEVRHTELFARLTSLYSGEEETPPPGIPPMPDDGSVSMREQVAREALQLSVISETYSSVLLSVLRERAGDPVVRQVLSIVISDEVHHARMGWAFLASLASGEGGGEVRARLAHELAATMDALVKSLFGDPTAIPPSSVPEEHRALAEAHGYLPALEEYALFHEAIGALWIPGLAVLGIDASVLADRYPRSAPPA
jgi:hypothetical protein